MKKIIFNKQSFFNNIKNSIKNLPSYMNQNALYITAFLIPFLIMMVIFVVQKIYPFGERSFLHIDMYHQYFPFLTEFYHKLKSGDSLFYSWNTGLGNNFLALYAYYLASPFNWLCFLVPESYLMEFQSYMVVFKIGLCGWTSCYYFRHHLSTKSPLLLFFSTFYALSGFMAAYNWNVMWLDVIFLAPLVIHGLEQMVLNTETRNRGQAKAPASYSDLFCPEKKYRLYCITLAVSILSNFYMCIMLCIYLVLYFFLVLLPKTEHKSTACKNFAFFSLLAGGIAAILWIPEMMALGLSEFSGSSFPANAKSYFAIFDVLARHCMDVAVEIGLDHWPNIYCSVAVFVLVPLYIICKSIPSREKMGKLILLAFLLISFCSNTLTFLWHGFNYPNSLPCRQSYLYILLLLTICAESALHLQEFTKEELSTVFFGVVVFLVLCQKLVTDDAFTDRSFLLSAVFLCGYVFLINLCRNIEKHSGFAVSSSQTDLYTHTGKQAYSKAGSWIHSPKQHRSKTGSWIPALKQRNSQILLFVFLLLFMLEAGLNTYYTSCPTVSRTDYLKDYDSYYKLVDRNATDPTAFSRFERDNKVTTNDGTLYSYPSASHFSSTVNGLVTAFYEKYGLRTSKVYYRFDGATPLTAALLNTPYTISKTNKQSDTLQQMVDWEGNLFLYKNNYTLPFGYVISGDEINLSKEVIYGEWEASLSEKPEDSEEYEPSLDELTELFVDSEYAKNLVLDDELSDLRGENIPLENQNVLARELGATEDIFTPVETENSGSFSAITIPASGHYYAFSLNKKVTETTAEIRSPEDDEISKLKFKKMNNRYILDLGFRTAGDVITLTAKNNLDLNLVTYRLEEEPFRTLVDNLNNQPFEISSFSSTKMEGTVDVAEAGYMILSLPYDPGWHITVDGEPMEPQLFEGMFLSLPMTEGMHEITLTYMPQGFVVGTIISLLSLGIFIMYCLIDTKRYHR